MAGSDYFKEVEFEVSESPIATQRPELVVKPNSEKIMVVLDQISVEMDKIKSGDSEFTHYAIDSGAFGSPVGNAFKRLQADQSVENIRAFVQLAGQDLGGMAQAHFKKMLASTLEEVPNV